MGSFEAVIKANNKTEQLSFYVIKNGFRSIYVNLLGKDTAIRLGVLKMGNGINQIDNGKIVSKI